MLTTYLLHIKKIETVPSLWEYVLARGEVGAEFGTGDQDPKPGTL